MYKIARVMFMGASLLATAVPIVSVISCSSTDEPDLFIFTGKSENVSDFKEAAKKFESLYEKATGKKINIKIDAAGKGVSNTAMIRTLLQKKSGSPDVVTSSGISDFLAYAKGGVIEELKDNDPDLQWANKLITTDTITKRLSEELKSLDGKKYGIPMNFESVGVVVNLKTLGKTFKEGNFSKLKSISGKLISDIFKEAGVNDLSKADKTDNELGQIILKFIYKKGWTWDDINNLIDDFNSKNNDNGAFAMAGEQSGGWLAGYHTSNNWLSTREGSATSSNLTPWPAYRDATEGTKPFKDKNDPEKLGDASKGLNKTPFQYLAFKSEWEADKAEKIANKSFHKQTKEQIEGVVQEYYKMLYGNKIRKASEVAALKPGDIFKYFADGTSLFTHASTGMYPWMVDTIGDDKISLNDIAPIPMPLNTKNIDGINLDKYKDIPVDIGMMWHIVKRGKSDERKKLAKEFLSWVSTGKTEISYIKDNKTIKVSINDDFGVKEFYDSKKSKLVNPFNDKLTGDITSRIIQDEIAGKDWGDLKSKKSDHVTFWANGAIGGDWGSKVLGGSILKMAGKSDYKMSMTDQNWNDFKTRLKSSL